MTARVAAMSERIEKFQDLLVYQEARALQLELFRATKSWPKEEMYSLIDQVRRASRSIGANIAEAWGKRRYPAHFESKLSDADGEVQETQHWLITAHDCEYINEDKYREWLCQTQSIGKKLGAMIAKSESFCRRASA